LSWEAEILQNPFKIRSGNQIGIIQSLVSTLDAERYKFITFDVSIKPVDGLAVIQTVKIHINNINDHPPVVIFTQSTFWFGGTFVITDADNLGVIFRVALNQITTIFQLGCPHYNKGVLF